MKKISSLKSLINISLKEGVMYEGFEDALLSKDKMHALNKDENEYWDYKEDLDLSQEYHTAKLAKYIMGFHNLKGGVIICGITNDFKVKGVNKSRIIDNVQIRNKVKKYLSKEVFIFQNQIEVRDNKILWLIFIPSRLKEPPVQVKTDYTDISTGKRIFTKSHYLIRNGDQIKSCIDPFDYERCFSDLNHSHLYAYLYDIDEPYFRLLAPHQDRFFGRMRIIEEIHQAFRSRSYIIALDGLGGVGKSAIAIELIQKLYDTKQYEFIISLSAKNKVWEGKISSRQAGFSGIHEMVVEIANVLQIDTFNRNLDELQIEVLEFMKGVKGILLIDNLETINDLEVISFIDKIPEPVKILITSKVTKYLQAKIISIPEMEESEAYELFYFELEKVGYNNYLSEMAEVKELILRTNYFPLAIKWAASLASGKKNLKEVLSNFKQPSLNKKEFLSFCFSSIYDELLSLSKDCALLIPYLGEKWNQSMLSISLNKAPQEIEEAIFELGERGILLTTRSEQRKNLIVLPLTMDYLSNKFHENKNLKNRVALNISNHLISKGPLSSVGQIFSEVEKLLETLKDSAPILIENKDYQKAASVIQLAIQTINYEKRKDIETKYLPLFKFLEGKMNYENDVVKKGLSQMIHAFMMYEKQPIQEAIYLSEAMLDKGQIDNRDLAVKILMENFNKIQILKESTVTEIFNYFLEMKDLSFIEKFVSRTNFPNLAVSIMGELRNNNLLPNLSTQVYLRDSMKRFIKLTLESPRIDEDLKKFILEYETDNFN